MYKLILVAAFSMMCCACGTNVKDLPLVSQDTSKQDLPSKVSLESELDGAWERDCASSHDGGSEKASIHFTGNTYLLRIERYEDDSCRTPKKTNALQLSSGSFALNSAKQSSQLVDVDFIQHSANGKPITKFMRGIAFVKNSVLKMIRPKLRRDAISVKQADEEYAFVRKGNPSSSLVSSSKKYI